MANTPVQVVLNSKDFVKSWDRSGGGPKKDFYAGKDSEFIAHKKKVVEQLSILKEQQIENEFSEVSYAKVILKPSALAKVHRPTTGLFAKSNNTNIVGAGDLGELFVELEPSSVDKLTEKVSQAEEQTQYKVDKSGREKPNPSKLRSEVGAIAEIVPYENSDKRKFTISEALDWLNKPQTGGAYIVELFEIPPPRQDWDRLPYQKLRLFKSFYEGLTNFGNGTVATRIAESDAKSHMIGVRLEDNSDLPNIQLIPIQSSVKRQESIKKISLDFNKHGDLLSFLEKHPLVKRITLPPIITQSDYLTNKATIGTAYSLPVKDFNKQYPKIGIVDGGISDILGNWIIDKWDLLSPIDKDQDHGTFIAGLMLSGKTLNGSEICKELDGCDIIDVDILPKGEYFANYYTKPLEFFKELEIAVKDLKARTGVRIFNFSLNVQEHVSSSGYSPAAKILDKIAEENDVIFIISAGNTNMLDFRSEWPTSPVEALGVLAASRNDIIKTPAESSRNLSVSALNPPNMEGIVPFALSNYSCRGPGMRGGLKPDLAHVGGSGTKTNASGHGLLSVDPSSNIVDGCGTSYAAPNVAKTLACIEQAIEGDVSRESLIGLAIHNASLPEVLADPKFNDVAKHLVGFGVPKSAEEVLEGSDNSITLVFAARIYDGYRMSFNFSWPNSLVQNGKCFGKARLTVVSTPPIDYNYGAEFVRVNIDAHLRQEQKNGDFKGRLESIYLPSNTKGKGILYEKNQIDHSFKWSPIKVSEKQFNGVGPTTSWRLDVEYLARDGEEFPAGGVPFTAILTISDPKGEQPVFNDMRQTLQALGVQILDIRTAARIVPRI